jgi:hypothetical protein
MIGGNAKALPEGAISDFGGLRVSIGIREQK